MKELPKKINGVNPKQVAGTPIDPALTKLLFGIVIAAVAVLLYLAYIIVTRP